jgi:transcriptional regulator with XRE-family HTH domain
MRARECLAHNIAHLRKERGFASQSKLAEAAEISTVVVGRLESPKGSYPDESTVVAIAKALDVPESRLFQDPNHVPKPTPKEALEVIQEALGLAGERPAMKRRLKNLEEQTSKKGHLTDLEKPPGYAESIYAKIQGLDEVHLRNLEDFVNRILARQKANETKKDTA